MSKTKIGRRGKFLVAMFAVTAAFAGGTQALAPAPAAALTRVSVASNCPDPSVDWNAWAWCELESGHRGYY
jgi:hypothetical protein